MTAAVLDASALLALILGEPGGDRVREVIAECVVNTVNLGEVVGHFARLGAAEIDIRRMLDPLPFTRLALDEEIAFRAGLLLPPTRRAGLSFGDRACLALANALGIRALTTDRIWQRIAGAVGVEVELIR